MKIAVIMRVHNHARHKRERGAALLLAIVFVALFGSILAAIGAAERNRVRVAEAEVAGWEMVEIARAARLFVRDQLASNPNLRTVAATPSRIDLATLETNGYLPPNFGRPQVGGRDFNALNQEIFIIMANWSPTGLGGNPLDDATVPSAFVFFPAGGKSTSSGLTINIIENARKFGATVTAPLFDGGGANISALCRGTPAVSIWDTGCLSTAEFATLVAPFVPGALANTNFTQGSVVMPAWKVSQQDLRAVMRYPQPDNPGYSTMLTDLELGTPTVEDCPATADQVSITTIDASGNPTTTFTGICRTNSDAAALERRFNIREVANLQAERVIAEPQALDGVADTGVSVGTGNEEALNISGNVTMGNDLRIYGDDVGRPIPANMNNRRLYIPNGQIAVDRNTYVYSQDTSRKGRATIGTVTSGSLLTDDFSGTNFQSTAAGNGAGAPQPRISVTNTARVLGDSTVTGTGEWIADTVSAPNATVLPSDNTGEVQITSNLNLGGNALNVAGAQPISGQYSVISGNIDGAASVNATADIRFLSASGSLSARSTRNTDGTGSLPVINTVDCLEGLNVTDACPNRQYFPPSITP